MEFSFDVMLYSNLGNQNTDAGNIKHSRGQQVPAPGADSGLIVIFTFNVRRTCVLLRTFGVPAQIKLENCQLLFSHKMKTTPCG